MPLSNQGQLELLRAMMERGLPLRTRARGFSMAPLIRDEDVVTVAPLGDRGPHVGEVMAFVAPASGGLALHRVVARDKRGWVLRGDNCLESDGVVVDGEILGRVVRVERNGRDVRFGQGVSGTSVAWLSRTGGLVRVLAVLRTPRRLASSVLGQAQGLKLYRAAGRRLTPGFAIMEAAGEDLEAARRWLNPAALEGSAMQPTTSSDRDWVAKLGTRIAGFAQFVTIEDPASAWSGHWLFCLVVRKRYRGLGIGEALTRRVIEEARSRGASELLLTVSDRDNAALRLYQKLGFSTTVIDVLEPELEAEMATLGERRVVMRKPLSKGLS